MNKNKTILSVALTAILGTSVSHAAIIDMDYNGLFTQLDPNGAALVNDSLPYYYDPTWGYGLQTQISGSFQYNTNSSFGTATVNPFAILNAPNNVPVVTSNFEVQSIGNNLLLGNMNFDWNGSSMTIQIVLDGSGLLSLICIARRRKNLIS